MARRVSIRGRVTVRQAIIDTAVRMHSRACMVADALKETHPELSRISVDVQTMRASVAADGIRYVWLTPKEVQKEIVRFDLGVKPKEFSFNIPQEMQVIPMRRRKRDGGSDNGSAPAGGEDKPKSGGGKSMAPIPDTRSRPNIKGGSPPPVLAFRREFGILGIDVEALQRGE